MTTKIVATILTFLSLLASGVLAIFGFAAFTGAEAIFQEIAAICMWMVAAVLLVAALLCVRIRQAEDARTQQHQAVGNDYLTTLLKTVEEIRDRGYDAIDRLESLSRSRHRG